MAVDERRPERARRGAAARGRAAAAVSKAAPGSPGTAAGGGRSPARRPARTGAIPGISSRVRLWLARATPKTTAAATRLRSARWSSPSRSVAARRRSQSDEQAQQDRARRARWRAWASAWRGDLPGDRRGGQDEPGGEADPAPAGEPGDEEDGRPGRDAAQDRGQEVHPESRVAERLEDDRGQPAQDHVGREAGRVAGARGAARPSGTRPCPRGRRPAGASARRARRRGGGDQGRSEATSQRVEPAGRARLSSRGRPATHQPSRCPQITPHRLIAIESADQADSRSPRRRDRPRGRARRGAARTARSRC